MENIIITYLNILKKSFGYVLGNTEINELAEALYAEGFILVDEGDKFSLATASEVLNKKAGLVQQLQDELNKLKTDMSLLVPKPKETIAQVKAFDELKKASLPLNADLTNTPPDGPGENLISCANLNTHSESITKEVL